MRSSDWYVLWGGGGAIGGGGIYGGLGRSIGDPGTVTFGDHQGEGGLSHFGLHGGVQYHKDTYTIRDPLEIQRPVHHRSDTVTGTDRECVECVDVCGLRATRRRSWCGRSWSCSSCRPGGTAGPGPAASTPAAAGGGWGGWDSWDCLAYPGGEGGWTLGVALSGGGGDSECCLGCSPGMDIRSKKKKTGGRVNERRLGNGRGPGAISPWDVPQGRGVTPPSAQSPGPRACRPCGTGPGSPAATGGRAPPPPGTTGRGWRYREKKTAPPLPGRKKKTESITSALSRSPPPPKTPLRSLARWSGRQWEWEGRHRQPRGGWKMRRTVRRDGRRGLWKQGPRRH